MTVLGISSGTRLVGIALIQNGRLLEYKIKAFSGPWSEWKLRQITWTIQGYVKRYKVDRIAVKIPENVPDTISYHKVIGAINVIAERADILAYYYSLKDLKIAFLPHPKNSNIFTLMEALTLKYPELYPEWKKERKNLNSYYQKVFEAVAVACL